MGADSIEMIAAPAAREAGPRPGRGLLLPRVAALGPRGRWFVYACVTALFGAALVDLLHVFLGLAPGWENALRGSVVGGADVAATAVVVLRAASARRDRAMWWLVATGFGSYTIGGVLWNCWLEYLPHPPNPSIADGFWLAMYPLLAVAFALAAHRSSRGASRRILVDGLVAGTAAAAACATLVATPLMHAAQRNHGAVVTDLMYPVADMAIGALAFAVLGIRGWRLDRKWVLLVIAFALWLLGDSMWALQISGHALTGNSAATLCYLLGCALIATAVWQSNGATNRARSRAQPNPVAPGVLALIPPALLLYDHFDRIPLTAFVLTWIALLAAMLRTAVAMRDSMLLRDVQRAALTDELTQLPNRRMFLERLHQAVATVERDGGALTTLMLDLDNFKQLNDTLGHDAGDELLRLTGPRLVRAAGDGALVARLGGDEFAVMLAPNCGRADAGVLAQRVLDSFNEPLRVQGLALRLTASVGSATFPQDADCPENLLKRADVAMYEAKRSRRGWEHYSAERDVNTRERLEMTGELAAALDGGQIEVAFQAIADTDTRRIRTAEALVRWRQPDGSLRPPAEFLEAAELAGLSRQLTRRVLALSLDSVRRWRAAGYRVAVSVNTTVADLLDESFPEEVEAALLARGLEPETLKIEVTENLILANPARVSSVLARLRGLGIRIALDDFGTGYSSLTHLRQLPVDRLKIDRSFVTTMCSEPTDAAIVYATVELAHRLGLKVIAEGVEDEDTWQALQEIGCDAVQGYGLSRPLEPESFLALLAESYLADSQSLPTPASTASGGSIA